MEEDEMDAPLRIPGIDGQVVVAAREMSDTAKGQPAWLWYENHTCQMSLGRWAKYVGSAPYIRADIVLAMLAKATPSALIEEKEG